jgi:hypothetical protein
MTDWVSDLLKVQEQIEAQLREADREAAKLALIDIDSPDAILAIDKS